MKILRYLMTLSISVILLITIAFAEISIKNNTLTVEGLSAALVEIGREPYVYRCEHGLYTRFGYSQRWSGTFAESSRGVDANSLCIRTKVNTPYTYTMVPFYHGTHTCNGSAVPGESIYQTQTGYAQMYSATSISGYSKVHLINCSAVIGSYTYYSGMHAPTFPVTIDGGRYEGTPALRSTKITVNKGTLIDVWKTSSTYSLGEGSEASVVANDDAHVTTVKLTNPPIVIDWSTFPGIDWADFPG